MASRSSSASRPEQLCSWMPTLASAQSWATALNRKPREEVNAQGSSIVCRCFTRMLADKVNASTLALNILFDDADDVVQGTAFPTDSFWFLLLSLAGRRRCGVQGTNRDRGISTDRTRCPCNLNVKGRQVVEPMPTNACAVLGIFVTIGTTLVQHSSVLDHAAVVEIRLQPALFTQLHGTHAPSSPFANTTFWRRYSGKLVHALPRNNNFPLRG